MDIPKIIGDDVVGNYIVIRLVGSGGFGSVYECINKKTGQTVAVKRVLKQLGSMVERERDVVMNPALKNKYLVNHREIFNENDYICIVMDLYKGDLEKVMNAYSVNNLCIPEDFIRFIGQQVCFGLIVLEQNKLAHRDLKPQNLFLDGEMGLGIRIGDFGIAKWLDDGKGKTQTNTALGGSLGYASPEHLGEEEITPLSDIFSLGCILYALMSKNNIPPFPTKTILGYALALSSGKYEKIPAERGYSRELTEVVYQMLEVDKAKRPSAKQLSVHVAFSPSPSFLSSLTSQSFPMEKEEVLKRNKVLEDQNKKTCKEKEEILIRMKILEEEKRKSEVEKEEILKKKERLEKENLGLRHQIQVLSSLSPSSLSSLPSSSSSSFHSLSSSPSSSSSSSPSSPSSSSSSSHSSSPFSSSSSSSSSPSSSSSSSFLPLASEDTNNVGSFAPPLHAPGVVKLVNPLRIQWVQGTIASVVLLPVIATAEKAQQLKAMRENKDVKIMGGGVWKCELQITAEFFRAGICNFPWTQLGPKKSGCIYLGNDRESGGFFSLYGGLIRNGKYYEKREEIKNIKGLFGMEVHMNDHGNEKEKRDKRTLFFFLNGKKLNAFFKGIPESIQFGSLGNGDNIIDLVSFRKLKESEYSKEENGDVSVDWNTS